MAEEGGRNPVCNAGRGRGGGTAVVDEAPQEVEEESVTEKPSWL